MEQPNKIYNVKFFQIWSSLGKLFLARINDCSCSFNHLRFLYNWCDKPWKERELSKKVAVASLVILFIMSYFIYYKVHKFVFSTTTYALITLEILLLDFWVSHAFFFYLILLTSKLDYFIHKLTLSLQDISANIQPN